MDRSRIDRYRLDGSNSISIAPGWAANVISWTAGGAERIYTPEDHPAAAAKLTGGGNPLLFPSVGRTWDLSGPEPVPGVYRIHGHRRPYSMPSHGILYLCDFLKVDEQHAGDTLTVAYEALIPDAVRAEHYPFDVRFTIRYTLRPGALEMEAAATNRGAGPAPVAFGYHPYFRIAGPERIGVQVRLPVRTRIFLTPDTVLPTGETEPTDGVLDLVPEVYYDHGFQDPTDRRMSLIDGGAGRTVHVDFGDWAEIFFAYAPDGTDFFCIEPWTRGLGAFSRLEAPNWESGEHIPVLRPGETRTYPATFTAAEGGMVNAE